MDFFIALILFLKFFNCSEDDDIVNQLRTTLGRSIDQAYLNEYDRMISEFQNTTEEIDADCKDYLTINYNLINDFFLKQSYVVNEATKLGNEIMNFLEGGDDSE